MNPSDQIQLINDAINKTKEQLKPTSVNFICWGILLTLMNITHLLLPDFIQRSRYSSVLFLDRHTTDWNDCDHCIQHQDKCKERL